MITVQGTEEKLVESTRFIRSVGTAKCAVFNRDILQFIAGLTLGQNKNSSGESTNEEVLSFSTVGKLIDTNYK